MNFLFVLQQLPFPPRDGVTIPTANLIKRLATAHQISLLLFNDFQEELSPLRLAENRRFVKELCLVERTRRPAAARVMQEISGRNLYFLGWECNTSEIDRFLEGKSFDVVWGSPLNVAEGVAAVSNRLGQKPVYVAAISDCNTSVIRALGKMVFKEGLSLKIRMLYALDWLRSFYIGRIEARILQQYDLVLVQTDQDASWVNKISNGKLNDKIMALPNGVNDLLFSLPLAPPLPGGDILFFATLHSGYGQILKWLLKYVWPEIKRKTKVIKFNIIGKGANDELRQMMALDDRIRYKEFVENISEVFAGRSAMLAPVFKGYGLINKVIESMAAGVPVVGDASSFNGIAGFENGRHGVIANDAKAMADAIINLQTNPTTHQELALSARKLVKERFSWEDRIKNINERLIMIKTTKPATP